MENRSFSGRFSPSSGPGCITWRAGDNEFSDPSKGRLGGLLSVLLPGSGGLRLRCPRVPCLGTLAQAIVGRLDPSHSSGWGTPWGAARCCVVGSYRAGPEMTEPWVRPGCRPPTCSATPRAAPLPRAWALPSGARLALEGCGLGFIVVVLVYTSPLWGFFVCFFFF